MSESDGPEDRWAAAHEDDLIGLPDEVACAMVRAAGFVPTVFRPVGGAALAAMKVSGQVLLLSVDGTIRRVRR